MKHHKDYCLADVHPHYECTCISSTPPPAPLSEITGTAVEMIIRSEIDLAIKKYREELRGKISGKRIQTELDHVDCSRTTCVTAILDDVLALLADNK